jgi:ADP-heptose:LPS heptosyltransferase
MPQTFVIHPGPLGDVLLAVPALRALRKRHGPGLMLAAQTNVGELLHVLGAVDVRVRFELVGLDRLFADGPLDVPAEMLAQAGRVVCWFGSRDPAFAPRLAQLVPGAIVAPPWRPDVPVWEHLLATIGEEPATADRAPLGVPARLVEEGERALGTAGWDGRLPLLIVHAGASGAGKRWPVEGWAQMLDAVRAKTRVAVMLHEGPADHEPVRALLPRLAPPVGVLANPSLPVLAAALGHARAFVGNDSGVSHLAAAVGVPSLVLVTSGMQAWEPWSPAATSTLVSTRERYPADVDAVGAALAKLLT